MISRSGPSLLAVMVLGLVAMDLARGSPMAAKKIQKRQEQNVDFLGTSNSPPPGGEGQNTQPPAPETPAPTLPPVETPAPTLPPVETPAPTLPPVETPAPTVAPTMAPVETHAPTMAPVETHAPTMAPETQAPTLPPTPETHAPTQAPVETQAPTIPPVVETHAPTQAPTMAPVETHAPTLPAETHAPTIAPTLSPETPIASTAKVETPAPVPSTEQTISPAPTEGPAITIKPLAETPRTQAPSVPIRLVDKSVFECTPQNDPKKNYPSQKDPCDHHFYSCTGPNGQAYEFSCAWDLYYDAELDQCLAFLDVPACSKSPRPAPPPTEAPKPVQPTPAPALDCAGLADGLYADPVSDPVKCSKRYFVCTGHHAQEVSCPEGLFFNEASKRCDYRERVIACTGKEYTTIIYTNPPPVTVPPAEFDCSNRVDGFYPVGCSNHYYVCDGSYAYKMYCAEEKQVFDMNTLACLTRSETVACGGSKRTTTTPTLATLPVTTVKYPLDCYGKPDGDYPDPENDCSHVFYKCSHNSTYRFSCYGELYFDRSSDQCLAWIDVFECSKSSRAPVKPTPPQPMPTLPVVNFDCSRKPDGDYANPDSECSSFYYTCSNSIAYKRDCYSGMFYNVEKKECDSWWDTYGCSKQTPPPSTPAPITTRGPTFAPVYNCKPGQTGRFEDPENKCSKIFYECVGGVGYKKTCPSDLYYDSIRQRCDYHDYVYGCTGIIVTDAPVQPTIRPTFPPVKYDCLSKDDGDYADTEEKCSHFYYTCTSGYALRRPCPNDQYFDEVSRRCDHKWNIIACGATPQPATSASLPPVSYTPRPQYPFDCMKRYDGLYAAGDCESHYWACNGGMTFKLDCGDGLAYDEEFKWCDYRYRIPKCNGTRDTPPPPTSTPTFTSIPTLMDCSRMPNGNYHDPRNNCSHWFIACSNGYASLMTCASNLFFDQTRNACFSRGSVPSCQQQGTQPPNEITTAVPQGSETPISQSPVPESTPAPETILPTVPLTSAAPPAPETTLPPVPQTSAAPPAPETSLAPSPSGEPVSPPLPTLPA